MLRRNFLRFLRCSSFETMEILFEVIIALGLMFFKKCLQHLRMISQSSSMLSTSQLASFYSISGRQVLSSSELKNLRNIATFTYFLPLFALMSLIAVQKQEEIFQNCYGLFPIKWQQRQRIFSDFQRLPKQEQNWLMILDQLFFFALKIYFSKVFFQTFFLGCFEAELLFWLMLQPFQAGTAVIKVGVYQVGLRNSV